MNRRVVLLVAGLIGVGLAGAGCSSRAWYQGLQERQRQQCYLLGSQREVQACLERVARLDYDEYTRLRRERTEPAP